MQTSMVQYEYRMERTIPSDSDTIWNVRKLLQLLQGSFEIFANLAMKQVVITAKDQVFAMVEDHFVEVSQFQVHSTIHALVRSRFLRKGKP